MVERSFPIRAVCAVRCRSIVVIVVVVIVVVVIIVVVGSCGGTRCCGWPAFRGEGSLPSLRSFPAAHVW
jgi:hypothetical protein